MSQNDGHVPAGEREEAGVADAAVAEAAVVAAEPEHEDQLPDAPLGPLADAPPVEDVLLELRRKQAEAKRKTPLHYTTPDAAGCWLAREVEIPIESVVFDMDGSLGQARPLDLDQANKRIGQLKQNEPDDLIATKVWEQRSGVFHKRNCV